ncbi:DUF3343 domain-containing protein [Anaerococcus ihuae]|uniref:DUF3343 domain-containing protein n=1 Tax=Anaerococcus ihuae TaxID=2899519 RepID=UPI001F32074D|nr:DUF3343 domain-containing protein [Anaerococcus ihuae]
MKLVAGFDTTSDALLMENFCKNKNIKGDMIPVPEEFGAGCGLAFRFESENFEKIKKILDEENVFYKILKVLNI